ncbi:MAG: aldo/keto reductase [Pseudomonadota bacterium]
MSNEVVFGTMQWGGTSDEKTAAATYHACREAGITWFDTAYLYTEGASEEILGRLIAADPDTGPQVATKVGYTGGAGATNIRAQFDISRRRLGLDRVDCLYLHRFDPETPLEESITAMAVMQLAGEIGSIGLSNYAAWQVMKAVAIATRLGVQIGHIQPMYSLVKRQAEVEILPMAADQGIAAHCYSPLGGGLLTGKYAAGGDGRLTENERYARRYGQAAMHEAATRLVEISRAHDVHAATLAVAWVAHQRLARPHGEDWAPVPIISGRDTVQLAPSLAAIRFEMDAELRQQLSALVAAPPPATDRLEEQSTS